MKKNTLTFLLLLLTSFAWVGSIISNSGGPDPGYAGGGPNTKDCTSCHNGTANTGPANVAITSDIPATGYLPANMYTITVSISNDSINKFGFETTTKIVGGNRSAGTIVITDTTNTQMKSDSVGRYQYAMHTLDGTSGTGGNSWSYNWEAPVAGTGDITLFAALLGANGKDSTAGDNTYTLSTTFSENSASAIDGLSQIDEVNIYPTVVNDLFNIDMMITQAVDLGIRVSDLSGKVVYEVKDFAYNGNYSKQISASEWGSGLYLLSISNGTQQKSYKLIVQ